MAKTSSVYICQQCGYQSPSYLGKCPNCGEWNTLVETITKTQVSRGERQGKKPGTGARVINLSEIKAAAINRTSTGINDLDQVLGGGIVPGMVVLVAGEPGIGKSTLLLEIAKNWGRPNQTRETRDKGQKKRQETSHSSPNSNPVSRFQSPASGSSVLYVAGEESASQIKIRADRLGIKTANIQILEETDVDEITSNISQLTSNTSQLATHNSLIIVDSIQTMVTADLSGTAGSVGQVRESASRLINTVKPLSLPLFLVGHVTKDGAIAGPKVLEHAVDTILTVEGEKYGHLRLIRTTKNRFGPTDEVAVLEMSDAGLKPVTNLQELFADQKDQTNPGTCLTIAMEGTRPLLVEIQALVTSTPLPTPRRVASGVDYNRLQTIIAILQKRLSIPLYKEDVYVSVAGGLKLDEPAADLPMALAIISSFRSKPLPKKTLAVGEVDLLGNVRRVNNLDRRIKEAKKLGFSNILSPVTLPSLSSFKI